MSGQVWGEGGYWCNPNIPSSRHFKEKNSKFTMEIPRKYHLDQVTMVIITSNKTSTETCPLIGGRVGHNLFLWQPCQKCVTSSLIVRKHHTNSNWGTFYKVPTDHYSSKCQSNERKGKMEKLSDWKRLKGQVNQMEHGILEQKNWGNSNKICSLVNSIRPMLISWFW